MEENNNIIYRISKLEITCPKEWAEALDMARETRDPSLKDCIWRLMNWNVGADDGVTIRIFRDYSKHCFTFSQIYSSGRFGIGGGIIYHGNALEGYLQNGSVQLEPSYGWHIHT